MVEINGWKVVAIIFIVLFILETCLIVWVGNLGLKELNAEESCYVDICLDSDFYKWDTNSKTCYCFNSNGDIIKEERIP